MPPFNKKSYNVAAGQESSQLFHTFATKLLTKDEESDITFTHTGLLPAVVGAN
jgi:hypothetical protein